jgi:hypothetical protein
MEGNRPLDGKRLFRHSDYLQVYVPAVANDGPTDSDFPPGEPPEIHYMGVTANYWLVLREGRMPYLGFAKQFNDEQMQWLRSIEMDVLKLLPGG